MHQIALYDYCMVLRECDVRASDLFIIPEHHHHYSQAIQVALIFRRKNLTANESSKETNSNFGKTEIFVERIESKERRRENNVSTKLSKFPLQCTSSCR